MPDSTAGFFRSALQKKLMMHPIFALSKFVRWYEGWELRPPRGSDGAKEVAYKLALESINSSERQVICSEVLARRRKWLGALEDRNMARRALLEARTDIIVNLVSRSPLELGLGLHHLYGFPILPGSALKGIAHRICEDFPSYLYGSPDSAGNVAILDGLPVKYRVVRDIMTPHFPKWYQGTANAPDDTESPTPIPFISIAQGSIFEIAMIARHSDTAIQDLDRVTKDLKGGLDELGLGAKTAAGYGVFRLEASGPGTSDGMAAVPSSSLLIPKIRTDFADKLDRIKALPDNPAGQIGEFLDWCLALEEPEQKKAAGAVIVEKMGARFVRDKAKSKEKWRLILELLNR
jgi:CRISPR-associated protein Cmr6